MYVRTMIVFGPFGAKAVKSLPEMRAHGLIITTYVGIVSIRLVSHSPYSHAFPTRVCSSFASEHPRA
jgi:hypothetical protein